VLPQPLSDLVAVLISGVTYVLGGWNGVVPNRDIYAVHADGALTRVGTLPIGVRYPAAGALDGNLIVAGGETATSEPTPHAWSFDPRTGMLTRLPDLPVATDHTSGAVVDGQFCILRGLRRGLFTNRILCWGPGERHWRSAGRLATAVADASAVSFDGGVAVIGGRGRSGPVSIVTLLGAS
jgi:N-acetylneuraminic acid mutarotase